MRAPRTPRGIPVGRKAFANHGRFAAAIPRSALRGADFTNVQ